MDAEIIYTNGFNVGYFMSKYELDLAYKILKNSPQPGNFLQGFADGKDQLEFENSIDQLHQLLKIRSDRERDSELIL